MVDIYVKKFTQNGDPSKSNTNRHPFSTWFPPPMKRAFQKEYGYNIYESDYILGPLYTGGDFQVGVTGTVEHGEKYDVATARELGEEIGFVPNSTKKHYDPLEQLFLVEQSKYNNKNMLVYRLYINDSRPISSFEHGANLSKAKDDRKKKAGCFLYGSKKDILTAMSKPIYKYKSPDEIVGIVAVKASDVYKHYL